MSSIAQGAISGAGIGSSFGPWGALAGGLIGGGLAGITGRKKQNPYEKKKQEMLDELLAGLKGEGPYSDLFNMNEDAFQKSYIDPAKSIFQNQIAPQIQQSYIASGQQRGTGLEDQLLRTGVNLDQLLNQEYMNYQQNAQRNQLQGIDRILNSQVEGPSQSYGSAGLQGISGYLSSPQAGNTLENIFSSFNRQKPQQQPTDTELVEYFRKGFER